MISQDPNDPKKLQVHHNTFILGESWDHAKEILEVADIAKRESGQLQIKKQALCVTLILIIIVINIL